MALNGGYKGVSITILIATCLVMVDGDVIRGTYHAWWVILPLPVNAVQDMINQSNSLHDIVMLKPTWESWPEEKHPVLMEIGREQDCGLIFPSWLRSNFLEYKFDIPFVQSKSGGSPLNYKVVLYEDSKVNSISSNAAYRLNATKASMKMTENSYTISKNGAMFAALFSSNNTWFTASAMPEFQVYKDVANLKWFGGRGLETCAEHHYDFASARIRPAAVLNMTFTPNLLNAFFPVYRFHRNPLSGIDPYGGIEVVINFTMSLPQSCLKKFDKLVRI